MYAFCGSSRLKFEMEKKKLVTLLILLGTFLLGGAAVFTAWRLSRPEPVLPLPSEAAIGGGENCTLTFRVTEPDLRVKKYVKFKGTDIWYSDTASSVSGVTVGTLSVVPGSTVVWKIALWNEGTEDIVVSETTDNYTNSAVYSLFNASGPNGTGPTYTDWNDPIPAGGLEVDSFGDPRFYRQFEAVIKGEEALLEDLGVGSHLSRNTVYVTDTELSDSASVQTTVEGEGDLHLKKYVCALDASGDPSSSWYTDISSSLSDVQIGTLVVDPGTTVRWKVIVWNSGTAPIDSSSTDTYDVPEIYFSFNGSSPDGVGPGFDWGSVPIGGSEAVSFNDSNLSRTFEAAVKDNDTLIGDLGVGTHKSINTAVLSSGESDHASIKVSPSGKPELHIKKYVRLSGTSIWHDDVITVSPGDTVEWRVVVWNTGNIDAEGVKVSDVYSKSSIYERFDGDPGLDGSVDDYIEIGTVSSGTTESTGVGVTFTARVKPNLAAGSYKSVNTATIVGTEKSDDAAIEVTVEEEKEEEEKKEVTEGPKPPVKIPSTGGRGAVFAIIASVVLFAFGILKFGFGG